MYLQEIINSAVEAAERGDAKYAAHFYQTALDALLANEQHLNPAEQDRAIRSIAFNLAQVLNRLRRFDEAIQRIEIGMMRNPTSLGRAIAFAAKGEALCGLRRHQEGMVSFHHAVDANPITGRLNSAESMLRLGTPDLAKVAEAWVDKVVATFGGQLDASQRGEVAILQKQIREAKKRNGSIATEGTAADLVVQAKILALTPGKLHEAANLLERALEKSPQLRDQYEYQLQLWRKGITM